MSLDQVRAIADAVLYEGYLLYPYRASSSKNQSRWQFGVLGPPQAAPSSFAESPEMSMQCLLAPGSCQEPDVTLRVRFLQVQDRDLEQRLDSTQSEPTSGIWSPVGELVVDGRSLLSWQEATECELPLPAYALAEIFEGARGPLVETVLEVSGACEVEPVLDDGGTPVGRIVRRRSPLVARVQVRAEPVDGLARLSVTIMNDHPDLATTKDDALRLSLISAHVVLIAEG
ncbi:MAG: hypothetical protein ABIN79_14460, partial [Marmoricola sp.]